MRFFTFIVMLVVVIGCSGSGGHIPKEPGHYIDVGYGLINQPDLWRPITDNNGVLYYKGQFKLDELEENKLIVNGNMVRYVYRAMPDSKQHKMLRSFSAVVGLYATTDYGCPDGFIRLDIPTLSSINKSDYKKGVMDIIFPFQFESDGTNYYIFQGVEGYVPLYRTVNK